MKEIALGLIQAVKRARRHSETLRQAICSVLDWLVDTHSHLRADALQEGLRQALDAYYRCLEHLLEYLVDHREERLQEALLLVYQAEDMLTEVESKVNEYKLETSRLWAA